MFVPSAASATGFDITVYLPDRTPMRVRACRTDTVEDTVAAAVRQHQAEGRAPALLGGAEYYELKFHEDDGLPMDMKLDNKGSISTFSSSTRRPSSACASRARCVASRRGPSGSDDAAPTTTDGPASPSSPTPPSFRATSAAPPARPRFRWGCRPRRPVAARAGSVGGTPPRGRGGPGRAAGRRPAVPVAGSPVRRPPQRSVLAVDPEVRRGG